MWLFPYHRFVITTSIKPDDAIRKLTDNVNPPPVYRWFRPPVSNNEYDRYFYGTAKGNVFKLHRALVRGRNSFLPIIKCEILDSDEGAKVKVRMRLHPIVLMFCLWVLIIGWFNKSTFGGIVFTYNNAFLFAFLAFYGLALFSFMYESKKDKEILLRILNGEFNAESN